MVLPRKALCTAIEWILIVLHFFNVCTQYLMFIFIFISVGTYLPTLRTESLSEYKFADESGDRSFSFGQ